MAKDYILFVHGVNTRRESEFRALAGNLFNRIQNSVKGSRELVPIYFFWGDLNIEAQEKLAKQFTQSRHWQEFWFRNFRQQQILAFVGDAVLYLSRHIGAKVVQRLCDQVQREIKTFEPGDRLHLVTHSWGTVMLFDILFAGRWADANLPASSRNNVEAIRSRLFGLPPNAEQGIRLASISTMGSPISLFSLLTLKTGDGGGSSHDLSEKLKDMLESLYVERGGQPLPWRNFAHPGDPIAYPLASVMPSLLDKSINYVDVQDVMTDKPKLYELPFTQKLIPILWGGKAHGSYWNNNLVATEVSTVIQRSPM